jgi:hypothetical protein
MEGMEKDGYNPAWYRSAEKTEKTMSSPIGVLTRKRNERRTNARVDPIATVSIRTIDPRIAPGEMKGREGGTSLGNDLERDLRRVGGGG